MNRALNIGPLKLATNLLLAPMAGYCDLAYRLVVRGCGGVGMGCTDLLCPEALLRGARKALQLAATCPEDYPVAIQLFGSDVERLCEAARWAEDHGASVVDLNMGCPAENITRQQGGSKLLCDPDGSLRIVERLAKAVRRVPFTVKLRLGWDDQQIVAPYMAPRMESAGVALIAVHGRTTQMRFGGAVRLDGIAEVVASVRSIPVIGNGDIRTPADARHMLERTGCAGVMIGRAALSAPWIFRDTWTYLTTGQDPPPPTLEEKCALMRSHFQNIVRLRGERLALIDFRQRISWYAKHLHPCSTLRQDMRAIRSAADFEAAIARFLDWRSRGAPRDEQEPAAASFG